MLSPPSFHLHAQLRLRGHQSHALLCVNCGRLKRQNSKKTSHQIELVIMMTLRVRVFFYCCLQAVHLCCRFSVINFCTVFFTRFAFLILLMALGLICFYLYRGYKQYINLEMTEEAAIVNMKQFILFTLFTNLAFFRGNINIGHIFLLIYLHAEFSLSLHGLMQLYDHGHYAHVPVHGHVHVRVPQTCERLKDQILH